MNNNITITLTGNKAYEYIRNESLKDSKIDNLLQENIGLKHTIDDLQGQKDALEYKLFNIREEVPEASYMKSAYPTGRLARDLALAENSEYEEVMEQAPEAEDFIDEIDSDWRFFVDTEIPDESIINTNWGEKDAEVVKNAIDKTDKAYYSVNTLAKYLNRTKASIIAKASRSYGAKTKNGLLISK